MPPTCAFPCASPTDHGARRRRDLALQADLGHARTGRPASSSAPRAPPTITSCGQAPSTARSGCIGGSGQPQQIGSKEAPVKLGEWHTLRLRRRQRHASNVDWTASGCSPSPTRGWRDRRRWASGARPTAWSISAACWRPTALAAGGDESARQSAAKAGARSARRDPVRQSRHSAVRSRGHWPRPRHWERSRTSANRWANRPRTRTLALASRSMPNSSSIMRAAGRELVVVAEPAIDVDRAHLGVRAMALEDRHDALDVVARQRRHVLAEVDRRDRPRDRAGRRRCRRPAPRAGPGRARTPGGAGLRPARPRTG